MMELLIIRHAIAVDRIAGASDEDDAARPLTARGKSRFKKATRGLHRLGFRLERLFTSPWTRAVETGALLTPIVERGAVEVTPHLVGTPRAELISQLAGFERAGVVGHEPWLGELVALLVLGDPRQGDAFPFKKGGVAVLEGEPAPGKMRLTAILAPRTLRRVG